MRAEKKMWLLMKIQKSLTVDNLGYCLKCAGVKSIEAQAVRRTLKFLVHWIYGASNMRWSCFSSRSLSRGSPRQNNVWTPVFHTFHFQDEIISAKQVASGLEIQTGAPKLPFFCLATIRNRSTFYANFWLKLFNYFHSFFFEWGCLYAKMWCFNVADQKIFFSAMGFFPNETFSFDICQWHSVRVIFFDWKVFLYWHSFELSSKDTHIDERWCWKWCSVGRQSWKASSPLWPLHQSVMNS